MQSLSLFCCKSPVWIGHGLTVRQRLHLERYIPALNKQSGFRSRCGSPGTPSRACIQSLVRTTLICRRTYHSTFQVQFSNTGARFLNTHTQLLQSRSVSSTQTCSADVSNANELSEGQSVSSRSACGPSTAWTEEASLYVHWPYCQRRCTYCNFNKYIDRNVDHSRMQQCLVTEACTLIALSGVKRIKSVFFGGGTPSLAKPQTLHAVLEAVSGLVDLPSTAEISMEGNPTSVGLSKLRDFKEAGINRVSLGIQALNDKDLKLLGRDHTTAESIQCIGEARRLFPGSTSLDLIFGRPGQTPCSWQQELQEVLAMCDDHVSLYQLTLERGTALFKMHERGLLDIPDDDAAAEMYNLAVEMMAEVGLERYEVSNFAKSGSECRHNQAYWEGGQYIGIGPGAHGRFIVKNPSEGESRVPLDRALTDLSNDCEACLPSVNHARFREARIQTLEPEPWMFEVLKYGHGTRKRVRQSQLDILQELLVTSMRTRQGVTKDRWMELSKGGFLGDVFREEDVLAFSRAGLIENDSAGLRATPKGLALLDSILPHLLLIVQDWYNSIYP